MTIETVTLSQLVPPPANPRKAMDEPTFSK